MTRTGPDSTALAQRRTPPGPLAALPHILVGLVAVAAGPAGGQPPVSSGDTIPVLGLEQGVVRFETPHLRLELVRASQTAAALRPHGTDGFDFTPSDWLERRAANGYFHLGDLTLRLRTGDGEGWQAYSTAEDRRPVKALSVLPPALAGAVLNPTLPDDIPLSIRRYWETRDDGKLVLRFELENRATDAVEIGGLGIPMVFNNILEGRSLDEAHALCSFSDPYIGLDAGYLQVARLTGRGSILVVAPLAGTPFEAYNPLLSDPTRRGVTFEGFYEWVAHSLAFAEEDWSGAEPWNPPTSHTLAPGETRTYGLVFFLADGLRSIEAALESDGRPVVVGVPGYVLPRDQVGRLFLKSSSEVVNLEVEPPGALSLAPTGSTRENWTTYEVHGRAWGRARITVHYADEARQTIHYKVIDSQAQAVAAMGRFLTTEAWYEDPEDPFGRSPSVITYDYQEKRQVTEDDRAWVAGLGDEGGGGAWLAAVMKQLVQPDPTELEKLQRFVDGVIWGGLQYDEGDRIYGVRKSMFFYEPDSMPPGTYSPEIRYGGWSSWDKEEALSVGRSYNYPHVAALHWVLYRLARNHRGLVTNHAWDWYLERAYQTGEAMVRLAPHYAQFGQMGGTVFLLILQDLQREGWEGQATSLEATMRGRADLWRSLAYPFGSEMPWDSTGQEEVYGWSRYFGYDEKALVTLNAILAYMPTVPHWGYNGSARRYWDFQYAGKLRRVERQLHHYGSALNAIPVLSEFRDHPEDLYLLRVGYAGTMGPLANLTRDGVPPSAFHAYPSTLRIDGITGDYGPGFLGHALEIGTYVARHPDFGWLAFGGNLELEGDRVRVRPLDSGRSRVYFAPSGLWLTLEAGTFEEVEASPGGLRLVLSPATSHTTVARLRIEQPGAVSGVGRFRPTGAYEVERGAFTVPLASGPTRLLLQQTGSPNTPEGQAIRRTFASGRGR